MRGIFSIAGRMRAVNTLLLAAEAHATADGADETAAEHIVLAALDIPGGSAGAAFARVGLGPEDFRAALAAHHAAALSAVGITAPDLPPVDVAEIPTRQGRYRMSPGGRRLFERVVGSRGESGSPAALGAMVVLALADERTGAAADALDRLGVDREALAAAARAEITAA